MDTDQHEPSPSLAQKSVKTTPACDWHKSEDGSECISVKSPCNDVLEPKPSMDLCPVRFDYYSSNRDRTPNTDRSAKAPVPKALKDGKT
jgi:hypothetical protein